MTKFASLSKLHERLAKLHLAKLEAAGGAPLPGSDLERRAIEHMDARRRAETRPSLWRSFTRFLRRATRRVLRKD